MVRKFFILFFFYAHLLVGARPVFVDLKKISDQYHLTLTQHMDTGEVCLKNGKHVFRFFKKSKEAFVDNVKVFLTYPIGETPTVSNRKRKSSGRSIGNHYTIAQVDIDKIVLPILFPSKVILKAVKTIVIDPGHGGKAEGTQNKRLNIKEKDLTLRTAKLLAGNLKRLGYVVYLTRNQDVGLTLEQRSKFANQKKADLFLSLHYNSAASDQAQGIETFAYSFLGHPSTDGNRKNDRRVNVHKFDGANTYLAWLVQKKLFTELSAKDRGVRRGRMVVLEDLNCPGVLVECGFLSNETEATKLKTEANQNALVNAISHAIQNFKTI